MCLLWAAVADKDSCRLGGTNMVMREGKPDDATRARMAQIAASRVDEERVISALSEDAILRRWCVEMAAKFPGSTPDWAMEIYKFVTGESAGESA